MTSGIAVARAGDRVGLMPSALVTIFILSHAFRTVVTIAAGPLAAEFGASAQAEALRHAGSDWRMPRSLFENAIPGPSIIGLMWMR